MRSVPETTHQNREYMTKLYRYHSIIALCCCLLTLFLSFTGIIAGVINTVVVLHADGFYSFIYFTMISNTLALTTSAFVVPFAVDGIRKKQFILPEWVTVMHYLSVCSITIVMVFVMAFMSSADPKSAFGGFNFLLHVVSPILILLAFLQIENNHRFNLKDCFIGMIPFTAYMVVYFVNVVIVGEENGGWPDIYLLTQQNIPIAVVIIVLLIMGFLVSLLLGAAVNALNARRHRKMLSYWKEDVDPVELKIEAYGLGSVMGREVKKGNAQFPLDVLAFLADKYGVDEEELAKAYLIGFLNGRKENDG